MKEATEWFALVTCILQMALGPEPASVARSDVGEVSKSSRAAIAQLIR